MSANVHRWHLTKGQQAMDVALAYPESKRGRGNIDSAKSVFNTDISSAYLSMPVSFSETAWIKKKAGLSGRKKAGNSHRRAPILLHKTY